MEIYLICNNLFENNLTYADKHDIEKKKMTRPLSVEGEALAKELSLNDEFSDVNLIYSSMFSSSLATAKYLAERINKNILVDEDLNDCKVGDLRNKSLKMVKFMQNHDFNIKLNNGESLEEVGSRIEKVINKIIYITGTRKVAVFTHKRTMLGYLIKHGNPGYNLDDNLVVEFGEKVVYNELEKDCDIVKVTFKDRKIVDMEVIDL
ncbi:MAG: histidine phosphatase family protein [Firmicutes bacterium]|nr:histidine phosphatase family protein [Bacillota bacterium]